MTMTSRMAINQKKEEEKDVQRQKQSERLQNLVN